MEILQNPYVLTLVIALAIATAYAMKRPEVIPAFLYLLLASLGAFFQLADVGKIALLKAVLLPILFLVLLFHRLARNWRLPFGNLVWVGLYAGVMVVSSLASGTQIGEYRAYFGLFLLTVVVAMCPDNEKTVRYLTYTIAIWGLLNLLAVIAEWSGHGWGLAYTGSAIHTRFRALGLMRQSTDMGIYFAISLNAVHVLYHQALSRTKRLFWLVLGVGLAVGLLGTLSRGAFAAWVISFLYIQYRLRGLRFGQVAGVLSAASVVLVVAMYLNLDRFMADRWTVIHTDPSAQSRIPLLEMGLKLFHLRPWLGVGMGQMGRVHLEAHNTYMQVLMGSGVVGLTVFLLLLWKAIQGLRRRARRRSVTDPVASAYRAYYVGLLGSLGAILIDGGAHVFYFMMPLWLILGFAFMA
jgi:O-antigen ligase